MTTVRVGSCRRGRVSYHLRPVPETRGQFLLEAILLATSYMRDYPTGGEEGAQVEIRSTDANVARDCLKPDTRNHHDQIEALSIAFSSILDTQPTLQIDIGWLPAAKGSNPLRRLKAIAAEAARQGPALPPPPPTKAQL